MGMVTVITSGKGGTGKSTVSVGLAAALVRRGNRVLLIDCDAGMRGIDLMLGVSSDLVFDIADVINGSCPPASAIYPCKNMAELYVLPAPQSVHDELSPYLMRQLTNILRKYYDHIIIDCPAGIGSGFEAAERIFSYVNPFKKSCNNTIAIGKAIIRYIAYFIILIRVGLPLQTQKIKIVIICTSNSITPIPSNSKTASHIVSEKY